MSRTKQEIVQYLLEQSSTDPILDSVSQSMVGKELMYFGANVIYQLESLSDAISRFQDISRADFSQLIAYAYTNDTPCDTVKPATVKISITGISDVVYAPYAICLQVGNLRFYNIDFVKSSDTITLYQGSLSAVYSADKLNALGFDSLNPAYQAWKLYKEFKQGIYQSSYIKLGANAVSDSVRVFARPIAGTTSQNPVFPYTEYNQSLSSPDAKLYKVRTGWDKSVNLLFGDSNWGLQVNPELYQYEVYWLNAGTTKYNISSNNKLVLNGDITLSQDSKNSSYFKVLSYTFAESDSLAYAKSFVQTKKFLQQGLVTVNQIKSYLNTLQSINSSLITSDSAANKVKVAIKPSDPTDVYFGFLEDYLNQYGCLGTSCEVYIATPLNFTVRLTSLSTYSNSDMVQAKQIVQEYCSYENLTLDTPVSSVILNQVLQQSGIFGISATIVVLNEPIVQDAFESQKLSATPVINTIKQVTPTGDILGFDSDGVFRQLSFETIKDQYGSNSLISRVGDYWFVSSTRGSNFIIRIQNGVLQAVNADSIIVDDEGNKVFGRFADFDEDYYAFYNVNTKDASIKANATLLRYAKSKVFQEGDTSIFNRLSQIRPIQGYSYVIELNSLEIGTTNFETFGILNGRLILSVYSDNGKLTIYSLRPNLSTWVLDSSPILSSVSVDPDDLSSTDIYLPSSNFFVLNGKLFIPVTTSVKDSSAKYSSGEFTTYVIYDPITNSSIKGTVSGLEDTRSLSAVIIDNTNMQILTTDGSKAYLSGYTIRFSASFDLLQAVLRDAPIEIYYGSGSGNYPTKIVSSGTLWLQGTSNTVVYNVISATEFTRDYLPNSKEFKIVGTVDYESGILYNVSELQESTLTYEVAGTLQGGDTYPQLLEIL